MLNINHIAGPRSRMRVQMAVLHAGLPNEIEGAPFRAAEVKEMFVGAVIDRLVRDRRAAKQEEIRLGRVELQLELVRDLESFPNEFKLKFNTPEAHLPAQTRSGQT